MYVKITVKCIFHKRESTNQHYIKKGQLTMGKEKLSQLWYEFYCEKF